METLLLIVLQSIAIFLMSSLAYDVIHWRLHQWEKSSFSLLRKFSGFHRYHHRFFNEKLKFDDNFQKAGFLYHLLPESIVAVFIIIIFSPFVLYPAIVVNVVFQAGFLLYKYKSGGKDGHHKEVTIVNSPKSVFFVDDAYHFMRHVEPNAYFSSITKIFDWLLGSGIYLKGKIVTVTGSGGALGSAMTRLLQKETGVEVNTLKFSQDYDYENYSKCDEVLKNIDILVLCHGTADPVLAMQAHCDSYVTLIERFKELKKDSFTPPEIWAAGSECELHPAFGVESFKSYLN